MPSSVILNLGITGAGKGFRVKELLKHPYYEGLEVVTIDPSNQFKDEPWEKIPPTTDLAKYLRTIQNKAVVLDEPQIYVGKSNSKEAQELEIVLSQCRHDRLLVVFNYHTLRKVPPYICDYLNGIWIGHTNDPLEESKKAGARAEKVLEALQLLNSQFSADPHKAFFIP